MEKHGDLIAPANVLVAVVDVAIIYPTVGLVDAVSELPIPSEYNHPCPNEVAPVPPFATASWVPDQLALFMEFAVANDPSPETSEVVIAELIQFVPLYLRKFPLKRLETFKVAPPNEILLPNVCRAEKMLAVYVFGTVEDALKYESMDEVTLGKQLASNGPQG